MLTDQVYNLDTPSSQLIVDSQLSGLGFTTRNPWGGVIQEDCLTTLEGPVQDSKKSQLPSKFTLFVAWLFLFTTVAAMLAPISIFGDQESYSNKRGNAESSLTLPE